MLIRLLLSISLIVLLTSCSLGDQLGLQEGERGAACYGTEAQSVNPFVNNDTYARVIEVETGNDEPVTPEQMAAIAEALGCN